MLDTVFIALLVLAAIWGFAKGMIKVVFSLGGYLAAFLVARRYGGAAADWIVAHSDWDTTLSERINENLSRLAGDALDGAVNSVSMQDITTDPAFERFSSMGFADAAQGMDTVRLGLDFSRAGDAFAYFALVAIASVLLFFATKLVLGILGSLISAAIMRSRILGTTDRLVGLAMGAAIGAVLVFFAVSVLAPISVALSGSTLMDAMHESQVARIILSSGFYENMMQGMLERIQGLYGA